jgi:hypothetical protein
MDQAGSRGNLSSFDSEGDEFESPPELLSWRRLSLLASFKYFNSDQDRFQSHPFQIIIH